MYVKRGSDRTPSLFPYLVDSGNTLANFGVASFSRVCSSSAT